MACCLRPGGCAASCAVPSCNSANVRAGASRAVLQTYGCLGSVCSGGAAAIMVGRFLNAVWLFSRQPRRGAWPLPNRCGWRFKRKVGVLWGKERPFS